MSMCICLLAAADLSSSEQRSGGTSRVKGPPLLPLNTYLDAQTATRTEYVATTGSRTHTLSHTHSHTIKESMQNLEFGEWGSIEVHQVSGPGGSSMASAVPCEDGGNTLTWGHPGPGSRLDIPGVRVVGGRGGKRKGEERLCASGQ